MHGIEAFLCGACLPQARHSRTDHQPFGGAREEPGSRLVRLETGRAQPEAIALYTKFGYKHIDPFGEYVNCPSSVCMEKELSSAP